MSKPPNPLFVNPEVARRYREGRPSFHPQVLERVQSHLALEGQVPLGADIGCGTGQSAWALTALARRVIALDLSPDMLAGAVPHPRVEYRRGAAEALPLEDSSVSLMTAALAFHSFDRSRFLPEAARVLRPGGTLVIYDSGFTGQMVGAPAFLEAIKAFTGRYPAPVRPRKPPLEVAEVAGYGLRMEPPQRYTQTLWLTLPELVAYLLTQAGALVALVRGVPETELRAELERDLGPFFGAEHAAFEFSGPLSYLHRPGLEGVPVPPRHML